MRDWTILALDAWALKPIDKRLGVSPFAVFVGAGFFVNLVFENDLRVSLGRAALEFANFLPMDHRGVSRDAVHEVAIMGDQDQLAFEIGQETARSIAPR